MLQNQIGDHFFLNLNSASYGVFFSSEKTKYSNFLFSENILMILPIFSSNFCYLQLIIIKFHGNEKQIVDTKKIKNVAGVMMSAPFLKSL